MERAKQHNSHIKALRQKLGISNHILHCAAQHVERGNDILALRLTFILFSPLENVLDKRLVLSLHLLLHLALLVDSLLLNGSFELILVLECLSAQVFLTRHTLFILLTALLAKLLFLGHHFSVFLEFKLDSIFSLTFFHLGLELHCVPLFFLLLLDPMCG